MPITVPTIDDRSYRQILDEALRRIRVHTPEWTNFNESDPGVTLLQVFAFLAESLSGKRGRRLIGLVVVIGLAVIVYCWTNPRRCMKHPPAN